MQEAQFYKQLNEQIQCRLCQHFCLLSVGEVGFCKIRQNIDHKLYSLVHNKIVALNLDPIEKKPLYHFLPASSILSIGTNGCNMSCRCCQNFTLSREFTQVQGQNLSPLNLINLARTHAAQSIAYTYNEPTIFMEYILETAPLAHANGLYNVLVTNAYQSKYALKALDGLIDAVNADLKCFNPAKYELHTGAKLKAVLNNIVHFRKTSWLELTTLIIPNFNDDLTELKAQAQFIMRNLGAETVWHLSAFRPAYKMQTTQATDPNFLLHIYELAKEQGLKNVYIGNSELKNNSYCPKCGEILIIRNGYYTQNKHELGICPHCQSQVAGVWK